MQCPICFSLSLSLKKCDLICKMRSENSRKTSTRQTHIGHLNYEIRKDGISHRRRLRSISDASAILSGGPGRARFTAADHSSRVFLWLHWRDGRLAGSLSSHFQRPGAIPANYDSSDPGKGRIRHRHYRPVLTASRRRRSSGVCYDRFTAWRPLRAGISQDEEPTDVDMTSSPIVQ